MRRIKTIKTNKSQHVKRQRQKNIITKNTKQNAKNKTIKKNGVKNWRKKERISEIDVG